MPALAALHSRMILTILWAVAATALLSMVSPLAVQAAPSTTIVVSEFRFRGAGGANDEFVEIRNIASYPVNIGGYILRGSNNAGAVTTRATVPIGKVLNAGCTYLFVNSAGNATLVAAADQTYATGFTDDGGVAITTGNTATIIDQVGLSAGSAFKEGTPLTSLGATNANNITYERKPITPPGTNNTDTDNNVNDFSQQTVQNPTNSTGCSSTVAATASNTVADFEGDGKTDLSVWQSTSGTWYAMLSTNNSIRTKNWGSGSLGDVPVPGDYDMDGRTDIAVWRRPEGNWYIINSQANTATIVNWGFGNDDVPVQGDYDGDNRTDIAVFRKSEGNWYIIQSTAGVTIRNWGLSTDLPVPKDYDGDGRTDVAVFRPSEGNWYIIQSNNGSPIGVVRNWGSSGDQPLPADYDGDGKADLAVFRAAEGNWYITKSAGNVVTVQNWGQTGDIPVPGDYDGDRRADIAVFRPNERNWYVIPSNTGTSIVRGFGVGNDVPVPAAYYPALLGP